VDEASPERFLDKVLAYRRSTLLTLFPLMEIHQAEELALGDDRVLLEKAHRLAAGGCPAPLAYRIMRPIPGELPEAWT